MNCDRAYEAMLVAEPEELRGIGESELARHIRGCEQCERKAARILEATALLSAQLNRAAAQPRSRTKQARVPAWLPLPIAAAIAGMLLLNEPPEPAAPRVGSLAEVKRPATRIVVNAPADGSVAVIRAADNVTVVWNLRAGGGS